MRLFAGKNNLQKVMIIGTTHFTAGVLPLFGLFVKKKNKQDLEKKNIKVQ